MVERFPLWLAPNLITFIGFIITVTGTLSVILQDMNCDGTVSTYLLGPGRVVWFITYTPPVILLYLFLIAGSWLGVVILCSRDIHISNSRR